MEMADRMNRRPKGPRVTVIGSVNVDWTVLLGRLPETGETVSGGERCLCLGGKGANQAVAAARCGSRVHFVGCVGDDFLVRWVEERLHREGLEGCSLHRVPGATTGTALHLVDKESRLLAGVAPGANRRISVEQVEAAEPHIAGADFLILQMQPSAEALRSAIALARKHGARVVLTPAPYRHDLEKEHLAQGIDLLVPNHREGCQILGEADCPVGEAALRIRSRYGMDVALTAGADGAYLCAGTEVAHVPAPRVKAVDAVGAGDTFVGALVTRWGEGALLEEAARFGCAAAALSVTKAGAQSSMPGRGEVEEFIDALSRRLETGEEVA
jgi:ribokinase